MLDTIMLPYSGCMPVLLCGLGLQASDSVLVSCLHSFTAQKALSLGLGRFWQYFSRTGSPAAVVGSFPCFYFNCAPGEGYLMQRAMGIWKWGPGLKNWTQGTRPCWGFSIALFLDEGFGSAVFRGHKRDVCWNSARYVDRQKYDWLLENRWQIGRA